MTKQDSIRDDYDRAVEELFSDRTLFAEYLRFSGRFYKLPSAQTIALFYDNPKAEMVADYETWQKFGRKVKPGGWSTDVIAVADGKIKRLFDISMTRGEKTPYQWALDKNIAEKFIEEVSKDASNAFSGMSECINYLSENNVNAHIDGVFEKLGIAEKDEEKFKKSFTSMVRCIVAARCEWNSIFTCETDDLDLSAVDMLHNSIEFEVLSEQVQITAKSVLISMERSINNIIFERSINNEQRNERIDGKRADGNERTGAEDMVQRGETFPAVSDDTRGETVSAERENVRVRSDDGVGTVERGTGADVAADKPLGTGVAAVYDGELSGGHSEAARQNALGSDSAQDRPRGVEDIRNSEGGFSEDRTASDLGERGAVGGTAESRDRGADNGVLSERPQDGAVIPENNETPEDKPFGVSLLAKKIAELSDAFIEKYDGDYRQFALANFAFNQHGAEYDLNKSVRENAEKMLSDGNNSFVRDYLNAIYKEAFEGRVIVDEGETAGELLGQLAALEKARMESKTTFQDGEQMRLMPEPLDKKQQAQLEKLTADLEREFKQWDKIFLDGSSDRIYEDGVALDLTRNHIIHCKRELKENFPNDLPEIYNKETPPEYPRNYQSVKKGDVLQFEYGVFSVENIEKKDEYSGEYSVELRDKSGEIITQDLSSIKTKFRNLTNREEIALDQAKQLITEYLESELHENAVFSDLSRVDIAYTTDPEKEIPIQVYVDLENYRLVKLYGGEIASEKKFSSIDDMLGTLGNLEFDELTALTDDERKIVLGDPNKHEIPENLSDDLNKFYVDRDRDEVCMVYYNPDSTAGGSLVYNYFSFEDLSEALSSNDPFEYILEVHKETQIDRDMSVFEDSLRDFLKDSEDFKSYGNVLPSGLAEILAEPERKEAVRQGRNDENPQADKRNSEKEISEDLSARLVEITDEITAKQARVTELFAKQEFSEAAELAREVSELAKKAANLKADIQAREITTDGDLFKYDGAGVINNDNSKIEHTVGDFDVRTLFTEKVLKANGIDVPEQKNVSPVTRESSVTRADELNFSFGEGEDFFTESALLADFVNENPNMSFALGNAVMEYLDEKQHSERVVNGLDAGWWYDKTKFYLSGVLNGEEFNYEGRFDIGDGKGRQKLPPAGGNSIIGHIADFQRHVIESNTGLYSNEDKQSAQSTLDTLVPFLERNSALTSEEQKILDDFKAKNPIRTFADVQNVKPKEITAEKVGDFYEFYGENARLVSNALGLQLSSKNHQDMVGFPSHIFSDYAEKLAQFGYTLLDSAAIAEERLKELTKKIKAAHEWEARLDAAFETLFENAELDEKQKRFLERAKNTMRRNDFESLEQVFAVPAFKAAYGTPENIYKLFGGGEKFREVEKQIDGTLSGVNQIDTENFPTTYYNEKKLISATNVDNFYEFYGETAEVLSEIFNLTLKRKRNEQPMVGVPQSVFDDFCSELYDCGYIVENWEHYKEQTPQTAGERSTYGKEVVVYYDPDGWFVTDANDRSKILEPKEYGASSIEKFLRDVAENNPEYAEYINSHISELSKAINNAIEDIAIEAAAVERDRLAADMYVGGGYGDDDANAKAEARLAELENMLSERTETVNIGDKFLNKLTNEEYEVVSLTGALPWYTEDCTVTRVVDGFSITENIPYERLLNKIFFEHVDINEINRAIELEQLSLFGDDEETLSAESEPNAVSIEYVPSANPKSVDELRVGDVIKFDGETWKITGFDGDFSVDLENIDEKSIRSANSIWGHWKEQFTDSGFEYLVPRIAESTPEINDREISEFNERKNKDNSVPTQEKRDFTITDENHGIGSAKEKFAANVAAIQTLKAIESENRTATADEQKILAKYVGWGGLKDAFEADNSKWSAEYDQLRELLTKDEYEAARSTTLTAYYTSPTVISAIYKALDGFGFKGGNVLEPSMGIGNFFGVMPEEMRKNSSLHGVELDDISGRIAKQLYQSADIQICGYENTAFPDNFFDAAVGNVPFNNFPVADTRYDREHFLIHDYFFAKTLDKVAPGGIVAFVTSAGTLDKTVPKTREYLAKRADLIGAIRLPNTAFKANAGTDVTADIIFLQKREKLSVEKPDWCYTAEIADGISVNQYFVYHPEMILGEMRLVSGRYGEKTACLPIGGADLKEQLNTAVARLKHDIMTVRRDQRRGEEQGIIPATADVRNFTFAEVNDKIYFRENNIMREIPLKGSAYDRVRGLIGIRNTFRELVDAQSEGCSDEKLSGLQFKLNTQYDVFVMNFGHITDIENRKVFAVDDDYNTLCGALELINPETKEVTKADIFTKRTIKPYVEVTRVDTPQEALFVSLDMRGTVDIDYMSELCGSSIEETISELTEGGFIYKNPETEKYEEAAEYLSGYVREKLRAAQKAAEENPEYKRNVDALEKALPPKLGAGDISVRLGAPWVTIEDYCNFFREYAHGVISDGSWRGRDPVLYRTISGEYKINNKNSDRSVAAQSSFGTKRMNSYAIFENLLNNRDIAVYDSFELPDGKKKRVMNKDETQLAQEKARQMKEAFPKWLWSDPERREKYVEVYNELFNSLVGREYDGSHQTFPGMNPLIELNKHQKNAVMRAKLGGNTLLAHCVGAGKTFEMAAAVMEKRRLGLINKACIVVPKHLVGQMAAEWLRLYPEARLLTAKENDFTTANRQKFIGRCCTGEYDAVIMSYQQFQKIPMSVEYQSDFLAKQADDLTAQLNEYKGKALFADEKRSVKDLERMKKLIEVRLKRLLDTPRDNSLSFEQLGFDCIVADEAHNYKNGLVVTKMKNVSGIGSKAAKKCEDFFMKTQYLNEKFGERNLILASGTPISNSMTELYIMQQYLRPSALRRQGLQNFDDWASTFGEVVSQLELKPAGDGFRMKKRFAKFTNLPELMQTYKDFADIRTSEMLNLPVPQIEGGKPQIISAKPNEFQQAYMTVLATRAEEIHNGSVDPTIDNMLKVTNEARLLGLDARCLNPDAENYPESKVNLLIAKVMEIYSETTEQKGVQAIFCDIAINAGKKSTEEIEVNPDEALDDDGEKMLSAERQAELLGASKFSVYDYIKEELIRRGVPENEICFASDAKKQGQRGELYAQLRAGTKRIVLASTAKMGTGANIQTRLCALHNLDIPWRPADFEQRIGRIVRQGNTFPTVKIFNYVTEGTFDAYMLNLIVTKQKFISQLMSGKTPARTCEDVDEMVLNYSEMQAIASGDPRIKEKIELDMDVSRLRLLESEHLNNKYQLEDKEHFCEAQISIAKKQLALACSDKEFAAKNELPDGEFKIEINGKIFTERKDAGAELRKAQMTFLSKKQSFECGEYRGFKMSLNWGMATSLSEHTVLVQLSRPGGLEYFAGLELLNDIGNITRIENALKLGINKRISELNSEIARNEKDLAEVQRTKDAPFEYAAELEEKSKRLAQLDAELGVGKTDETIIDDGEDRGEDRNAPNQNRKPKRPKH